MRVRAVLRAITYITQYHPVGDAPCGRPENERCPGVIGLETTRVNRTADRLERAVAAGAYAGPISASRIVLGCALARQRGLDVYDTIDGLLADDRVDAVLVSTPTAMHDFADTHDTPFNCPRTAFAGVVAVVIRQRDLLHTSANVTRFNAVSVNDPTATQVLRAGQEIDAN